MARGDAVPTLLHVDWLNRGALTGIRQRAGRARIRAPGGAPPKAQPAPLEAALGHKFTDIELLRAALQHSSMGRRSAAGDNFDRLEFLGDRVVGLITAELLLARYPQDNEGAIARRHAALVNRDTLAYLARSIGLGAHLVLSSGEARSGGGDNPAVLADALEAVVAALYHDGGLDSARTFLAAQFAPLIEAMAVPPRDAKTTLQEWSQGHGFALPAYRTVEMSGPAHRPRLVVEVKIEGLASETAEGSSKRVAEQAAAAGLLRRALGIP